MMNLRQHLLGKLAKEAAEIAQIALKTQQFGFDEKCPGQDYTNAERTHQEIDDLRAIVDLLNDLDFDYYQSFDRKCAKKTKVLKYLEYSVSLNMVEPDAIIQAKNLWGKKYE